MNAPTPDLREERLARELRAAAHEIDLTPGSELAVVTRGRRRRHRQRRATTFTLVSALAAGTALGVQQLSRNGDSSIASDQAEGTVPTLPADPNTTGTTAPVAPPAPSTTPLLSAPVAATVAPFGAATSEEAIPDDVEPAQLVESNYEWSVVAPDSAEAVGFVTMSYSTGGTAPRVPGLFMSTAPGKSDDFEPAVWRTDDGISWEQVALDVPVGGPWNVVIDGSNIYNIGTAPGIAATEPNPLVFAASADAGASWREVELPIDTNEGRDLPLVLGTSAYAVPVPIDGGVLVLTNRYVNLDWEQLTETDERIGYGLVDIRPEGVTVQVDSSCTPLVATTAVVGSTPGASGPLIPLVPSGDGVAENPCPTELLPWDELGVPAETAELMTGSTSRAFVVRGDQVEEIDVPVGLNFYGRVGDDDWFSDIDNIWYTLDEDAQLVASDPPAVVLDGGTPIGTLADVSYRFVQTATMFSTTRDLVVGSGPDGDAWTDWTGLYGDDVVPFRTAVAATDRTLVSVAQATLQPVVRGGSSEASDGGLTIRRSSMRADPTFELTSTGESLPIDRIFTEAESGDLVAVDDSGAEIARMGAAVATPILYGMAIDGEPPATEWYVETSEDGRTVAVERLAPLLGLDDSEISSVPRVSTDGTRIVIAVTLNERDATGARRQLVLVGTPKT